MGEGETRVLLRFGLKESSGLIKLERAVCNHGFFMMAPNVWLPSPNNSLVRPLQLESKAAAAVLISISQPLDTFLQINLLNPDDHDNQFSPQDLQAIKGQVQRMLRISERHETLLQKFHDIHPEAKHKGFGRIFRSPTLFEDIVKSVLLCNCSWSRSLEMARALCDLQHQMSKKKKIMAPKRKRSSCAVLDQMYKKGNFPSPKELVGLDEKTLDRHCKLGYRAAIILRLARDVDNGTLDLRDLERQDHLPHTIFRRLLNIKDFGPFTASNVMMCLGFYQYIPVDTETIKHLQQVHSKGNIKKKKLKAVIEEIYGKYSPFQSLAYWLERVNYYEERLGKLSELPYSEYANVTSTKI